MSTTPRVIVLAGAPCSGKGTQAKKLAKEIGAIHLSIGDVFRDSAAKGDELAKAYMASGNFLPDEIAIALVRDRMKQPDVVEKGVVLDGFPRTGPQAKALLGMVKVSVTLCSRLLMRSLRSVQPVGGWTRRLEIFTTSCQCLRLLMLHRVS